MQWFWTRDCAEEVIDLFETGQTSQEFCYTWYPSGFYGLGSNAFSAAKAPNLFNFCHVFGVLMNAPRSINTVPRRVDIAPQIYQNAAAMAYVLANRGNMERLKRKFAEEEEATGTAPQRSCDLNPLGLPGCADANCRVKIFSNTEIPETIRKWTKSVVERIPVVRDRTFGHQCKIFYSSWVVE